MKFRSASSPRRNQGFVLIAVLVVILLSSMVAVSLLFRLKAEDTAVAATQSSEQAWSAAMCGVQEAMRQAVKATPGSLDWQDNPRLFRDRFTFDDGSDRWYFTIFSPAPSDSLQPLRYGLTDEASKVNLNEAHTPDLTKLPRFTAALTQSLRDFVDADSDVRPDGAEQDYYDGLSRAYVIRNGRLNTVEELLMVRGFTPSLIYGEDLNMNFRLDLNEDDGDQTPPLDNADGKLDPGLRGFLTTFSYDPNTDSQGATRTKLWGSGAGWPGVELPPALTNFISVLRREKIDLTDPAELLEATVSIKDPAGKTVEVTSGVGKAELPLVLEHFTTRKEKKLEGLININTASIQVLATLPEVDEPLAEAIASARGHLLPERRTNIAWLFQEDVVDAARFKKMAPHITARSSQYSFHVAGYGVPSGRFRVLDVVIDLGSGAPTIAYLRDITRLGIPFSLESTNQKEAAGG